MKSVKVYAIVPARGGSKGLKKKNIQKLCGKPLLCHTIEHLKKCKNVAKIIVSTDDNDIKKIALNCGADVPFLRPADISQDDSTTDEVLQHALNWVESCGEIIDAILWCHPTMPFRKSEWLDAIIDNLIKHPEIDSSFIVCSRKKNYWTLDNNGAMKPLSLDGKHPGHTQRQRKKPVYQEECGLGCVTRAHIIKEGRRIGDNLLPYAVDYDLATVDIHDEFDLWVAEQIMLKLGKS